jgi:hypothetical protein
MTGEKMQATVPAGKKHADVMQVHMPRGEEVEVVTHAGLSAGQSFQFDRETQTAGKAEI